MTSLKLRRAARSFCMATSAVNALHRADARAFFTLLALFFLAAGTSARLEAAPSFFAYIVADQAGYPKWVDPRVTEIDVRTDLPNGDPISVGSFGDEPTGYIAISPGGRYVYVGIGHYVLGTPGGYNDHRIAVVDTQARTLVKILPVSAASSAAGTGGMAVTPDGGTLYAYRGYDLTLATHVIAVLSLPSGELRGLVALPFGSSGSAIAVSPNGNTVVAQGPAGATFIDRESNTVSAILSIAGDVKAFAFSPDSATMYVLTSGQVLRVDVRNRVVRDSISLGTFLRAIAVSPDGRRLYITDGISAGRALVVNTDLWQTVTQVPVGDYPDGVAVTPAGDKVYVTLSNREVVVLSTATNTVTGTIDGLGPVANRGTDFAGPGSLAILESIEYFHKGFGHYFTTNSSVEIDKLDAGDFVGWDRTGGRFNVFVAPTAATRSVCRFSADSFAGKSSHFFAPRGFGCEDATRNPDWQYEGDVYYVRLPDLDGACPAGTVPVYRLYNNGQGGAPNHRLTARLSDREAMLARGWIAEGSGIGVGMCASGG